MNTTLLFNVPRFARLDILVLYTLALLSWPTTALDLVIENGRIIDPETGFDEIANVGIDNGQVVAITRNPLSADAHIDATGLVVAPGFIDLHAHGQDPVSNRFQAGDGVTTALELEIGTYPVGDWYTARAGKSVLNHGTSTGHPWARGAALEIEGGAVLTEAAYRTLSPDQQQLMLKLLHEGAADGGIGIGMGITYTPAADRKEIFDVFETAAAIGQPVFVHMRNQKFSNGDLLGPLQEVMSNAMITGASLHVVHLNSSMGEDAQTALKLIRQARLRGFDVTSENYPYTAGSTRLESALFDGWTNFAQLQWVATGERLDRASFEKYRAEGGWVIIHSRTETLNAWLVGQPDLIIASDGIPFVDGLSHPRSAGTFARILGRYTRDEQRLTLMQALAKMTIKPARRLESFVPAMRNKGRLQVGSDADITVFDPGTIIDRATYTEPGQYSAGILHVLVGGVAVVRDGIVREDVFPGQAVRGSVVTAAAAR